MISIVMTYYNRVTQLRYSLKSLCSYKHDQIEVIIVDDFSEQEHSLDSITDEFPSLNIHVIKMSNIYKSKTYFNPCIPFNVGFRESQGDKIIIQNPECCHMGDVIQYTMDHLSDNNYLAFHCFAGDKSQSEILRQTGEIDTSNPNKVSSAGNCWYVHDELRPCAWHFTSAITRNNLIKLNGFDERFAHGRGSDDVEFLYRVQNLGLNIKFVSSPFVVHQWHPKDASVSYSHNIPTTQNTQLSHETKITGLITAPNNTLIQ
jgi:GT2 family glycosyltransferase